MGAFASTPRCSSIRSARAAAARSSITSSASSDSAWKRRVTSQLSASASAVRGSTATMKTATARSFSATRCRSSSTFRSLGMRHLREAGGTLRLRGVERLTRLKRICWVALVGLAFPAAASAAPPLFSQPSPVGGHGPVLASGGPRSGGGGSPEPLQVALGPNGEATVAWLGAGGDQGQPLLVAERPPGGGASGAPVELSADGRYPIALARNDGGVRAIAWPGKLSVAPAGGSFGQSETVPIPPRAPVTRPEYEDSRTIWTGSVAVASDGSVLLAYTDSDSRADNQRAVTVLRRPDGTWTEPQILDDYAPSPQVIADAAGGLHVMWTGAPRTASEPIVPYVADAGADGQFAPGHPVSRPDWRSAGLLTSNRRGDLLVTWSAQVPTPVIGSTYRPAGGDWQSPQVLYGDIPYGERPSGALDDRGDAAVAWTNGDAFARSRPAGNAWGPTSTTFVRQGSLSSYQLAMDPNGTGLLLSAACRSEGTIDTIAALALPRGAALEPVVRVSRGVDPVSQPAVATDAFGNGLVVWLRGPRNEQSTVFAAGYSAAPPNVTGLAAKHNAFALKVSEPARLSVTLSGRHRRATQWSRVRPGKNTLPFRGRVRSLLARHGRY